MNLRLQTRVSAMALLLLAGCGNAEKPQASQPLPYQPPKPEAKTAKSSDVPPPPKPDEIPWITRGQIEDLFARMKEQGLDVGGPLRWSFFFTAGSKDKLTEAGSRLAAQGYEVVRIFKDEKYDFHWLHIQREAKHTEESLDRLNVFFYKQAPQWELQGYEGFQAQRLDDPPIEAPPPRQSGP
ncbi:MAG: hypothetical protein AMXMBFR7_27920 [Planctomycetota bacterium]